MIKVKSQNIAAEFGRKLVVIHLQESVIHLQRYEMYDTTWSFYIQKIQQAITLYHMLYTIHTVITKFPVLTWLHNCMYQTKTVNSELQYLYRSSVVRDTQLVIDGDGPWLKPSLSFFQSIRTGQVTHTSCLRVSVRAHLRYVWWDQAKKPIRYLSDVGPAIKMLHGHLSLCEDSSYYVLSVDQSKHNMLTHVDLKLDNHPGSRVPSRVLDVCDRERTWIMPRGQI